MPERLAMKVALPQETRISEPRPQIRVERQEDEGQRQPGDEKGAEGDEQPPRVKPQRAKDLRSACEQRRRNDDPGGVGRRGENDERYDDRQRRQAGGTRERNHRSEGCNREQRDERLRPKRHPPGNRSHEEGPRERPAKARRTPVGYDLPHAPAADEPPRQQRRKARNPRDHEVIGGADGPLPEPRPEGERCTQSPGVEIDTDGAGFGEDAILAPDPGVVGERRRDDPTRRGASRRRPVRSRRALAGSGAPRSEARSRAEPPNPAEAREQDERRTREDDCEEPGGHLQGRLRRRECPRSDQGLRPFPLTQVQAREQAGHDRHVVERPRLER